jgi:hypothetical protein
MASTVQSPQIDILTQIFTGLKNKHAEIRLQSATQLRLYVGRFHNRC